MKYRCRRLPLGMALEPLARSVRVCVCVGTVDGDGDGDDNGGGDGDGKGDDDGVLALVLVLTWALAMAFGTCCPACQHAPPSPWRRTALGVGGRRDPWLEPECTCGVGGGLGGGVGLLWVVGGA